MVCEPYGHQACFCGALVLWPATLQNTIMIQYTLGICQYGKSSPFSLQLYKNKWSFLNVYRAQIGKDGTPKMNLSLIQYRQWDFVDNDLLHGTHRLSRLLIVKSPDVGTVHATPV